MRTVGYCAPGDIAIVVVDCEGDSASSPGPTGAHRVHVRISAVAVAAAVADVARVAGWGWAPSAIVLV